ncbi:hypothetical protein [Pasteurella multocida]|uniref:hypothetical protein n=1 Tax=Pasteurella multocida TaxID=747 RepID=UPI002260CD48|nr:hypothetical protein [Pasteurella multocida]UZV66529.1 hypothetical protein OR614_08645 [Pasteurella multocida]
MLGRNHISGQGLALSLHFSHFKNGWQLSLTVGVITMLVNSYYKKKENERKNAEKVRLEELHKLRVERMRIKLEKEKAGLVK